MPEEKNGESPVVNDDAQNGDEPKLSNADLKNTPWVKQMAEELNQLRADAKQRLEAEEVAKKEAELKALEDGKQYEQALEMQKQQLESLKTSHAAELLNRDLQTELLKAGFTSGIFIKGAVSGYEPESGSVADYVKGLAEAEENKMFLGGEQTRTQHSAPGKAPVQNVKIDWAQNKENKSSRDPAVRKEARANELRYYQENGSWPS